VKKNLTNSTEGNRQARLNTVTVALEKSCCHEQKSIHSPGIWEESTGDNAYTQEHGRKSLQLSFLLKGWY
jgi:hypothetical protein